MKFLFTDGIVKTDPICVSDELRLIGNDSKHPTLQKHEVEIALGYIQTWPQR